MSSASVVLAVGIAGGLGAALRFLFARAVQRRLGGVFPFGTLVVNASGSFLLALVADLAAAGACAPGWATVLGVGLAGGYTTYSTFNYETLRLLEDRALLLAVVNVVATLVICAGAGVAGMLLARAL